MAKCSSCGRNLGTFSFGKKLCQWCVEYEKQRRGETKPDDYQRVMPTPWAKGGAQSSVSFHQLFVGICVLVFMAMVVSGISLMDGPNPQQMVHWGANFGPLTLGGQPWRLVTYMFLHYGIFHIGFNMWCLWDLGALAESLYGDWTFAFVYLACGLGGGIASVWWHPGGVSAGASGAIFGLAGALIASLKLGEFSLPRAMTGGALRSVIAFAIFNLVLGAFWGLTDNACHIGGLVTGLIIGALIAVVAPERGDVAKRIAVCLFVLLLIGGGWMWVNHTYGFALAAERGETLLEQGKTDDAITQLKRAVSIRDDFAAAHFNLARAYQSKGDSASEIAELRRVVELDPKNPQMRYVLGTELVNAGQLAQARDVFQQMIASDSRSADGHVGLGMIAVAQRNDTVAVQEFETALKLDPNADAYYDLGAAYLRLKRSDDAITALQHHQKLSEADDYDTEMALAAAYRAKGMQKESADALQKAAALKTN
jgi:rhomboid protease GluP